jgi:hypothetical protein
MPIREYLPELSITDIISLKKKRIMFIMDQLMSLDENYLLSWQEVKNYNQKNFKRLKPKWFKNLEENYILSDMKRLTHSLQNPICNIDRHHKHLKIKAGVSKPKQEWTVYWNNNVKNTIIGKTVLQESATSYTITYSEHYIPHQIHTCNITPDSSSRNLSLILVKCNGCSLHSYFPPDLRPKCVISTCTKNLSIINIQKNLLLNTKHFSILFLPPIHRSNEEKSILAIFNKVWRYSPILKYL